MIASILGAAIGALGLVALGAVLASRGHPRAGLWTMVTGVTANVLAASGFGIAALAQPAIGRDYLAGHTAQASLLVRTVVNGEWMNVTAITSSVLLAASVVVAGVAVTRTGSLPRAAGIGFAISMVLFAIGAIPDNFLQSIADVLMIASTAWIAAAAGRLFWLGARGSGRDTRWEDGVALAADALPVVGRMNAVEGSGAESGQVSVHAAWRTAVARHATVARAGERDVRRAVRGWFGRVRSAAGPGA